MSNALNGIKLALDGYSGWIDLSGLNFSSQDEMVSWAFDTAGTTSEGKRFFWLSKTNGDRIQAVDHDNRGVDWFLELAPDLANELAGNEEEGDEIMLTGVQPIFPRSSISLHLLLWLYASIVRTGRDGVFSELRRFVRALQFAHLYGWSKDLNQALIDGAKGNLLFRRALAFALTQFLILNGKKTFGLLVFVFAYAIYIES